MEGKTNSTYNPFATGRLTLIYTGNPDANIGSTTPITINCPTTITPIGYILELSVARQAQYGRSYASTNIVRNFVQVGTTQNVACGIGYGTNNQDGVQGGYFAKAVATKTYCQLQRTYISDDRYTIARVYAVH